MTPLLAEKWDFSPDLKTLTFTLKPNVKFQDGEPFSSKDVKFSFERFAAKDSTNKDKAFFASIESIDTPDPMTVVLKFKQPSFEALFHLGMDTAVILDEKSATSEATNPVGTGAVQARLLDQGLVDHARQVGRLSRRGENPARTRDLPLHLRSLGGGRGDARRRRRRLPALRQRAGARPVQERSALPGAGRRDRGQDHPRHEQQEEAARRSEGAAGDRLCDRPQGDHRRGDGRARDADRQPSHAERSRLCRPHRHVSARSREGEGAAEGGGRRRRRSSSA